MTRHPLFTILFPLIFLLISGSLEAQNPDLNKPVDDEDLRPIFDDIYHVLKVMDGRTDDGPTEVASYNYISQATLSPEDRLAREQQLRYVRSHADCEFRISPEGKFRLRLSVRDSLRKSLRVAFPSTQWWAKDGLRVDTVITNNRRPLRSLATSYMNGTFEATNGFLWGGTYPPDLPEIDSVQVSFAIQSKYPGQKVTVTKANVGDVITLDTISMQLTSFGPGYALFSVPAGTHTGTILVGPEDDEGRAYRFTGEQESTSAPSRSTYSRQYPPYLLRPFLEGQSLTVDEYFEALKPKIDRRMGENGKSDAEEMSYFFVRFVGPVTRLHLFVMQTETMPVADLPCPIKRVPAEQLNPKRGRANFFNRQ